MESRSWNAFFPSGLCGRSHQQVFQSAFAAHSPQYDAGLFRGHARWCALSANRQTMAMTNAAIGARFDDRFTFIDISCGGRLLTAP